MLNRMKEVEKRCVVLLLVSVVITGGETLYSVHSSSNMAALFTAVFLPSTSRGGRRHCSTVCFSGL
jgi:hypothetical protein